LSDGRYGDARALYLYEGNKDTLYRIHGTNQPE
jgi:lipoprotein-anchoring transpeptidase ErfK/SrfK